MIHASFLSMRTITTIIIAALVLTSAAFSLETPEPELLLRFLCERLIPQEIWVVRSRCTVIAYDDTLLCENQDTISSIGISSSNDCAGGLSPFALSADMLFEPVKLIQKDLDSLKVNKSRTRLGEVMCWKLKLYDGATNWVAYLTADGLFRVVKIERRQRNKAYSNDIWLFSELCPGRDLPKSLTRTVAFNWGGSETILTARRELTDVRRAASEDGP